MTPSPIPTENSRIPCREQECQKKQVLYLSDKDKERIAAAMAVATYCAGIPKIFDVVQLDTKSPPETATSYAKAMLVVLEDPKEWCDLIDRLSNHTDEKISLGCNDLFVTCVITAIEKYAVASGKYYRDFSNGEIVIYRSTSNKNDQIKVPLHPEYLDYSELLYQAILSIIEHEKNKVLDDLGVIHGEDAKRFMEHLNDDICNRTPEFTEMIKGANDIAKNTILVADPNKIIEHDRAIRESGVSEGRKQITDILFPKSTVQDKKDGWMHDYGFIERISRRTESIDEFSSGMEEVQNVLIALEETLSSGKSVTNMERTGECRNDQQRQ